MKKITSQFWGLNPKELKEQVQRYDTLKITQSYRGMSVLIVSALLFFSFVLSYFGVYSSMSDILISLIVYIPILFFVYKGHRWAIISLFILWTLEKIFGLYFAIELEGFVLGPVIWWFIVTPYIYKALLVENEHKKKIKNPTVAVKEKYCKHCGEKTEFNAKFCIKCGEPLSKDQMSEEEQLNLRNKYNKYSLCWLFLPIGSLFVLIALWGLVSFLSEIFNDFYLLTDFIDSLLPLAIGLLIIIIPVGLYVALRYKQKIKKLNIFFDPRSGKGSDSTFPEEAKGFNIGPLTLGIFWGARFNVLSSLLILVPFIGLIWGILGIFKGNEWAWRKSNWQNVDEFKKSIRSWNIAGMILLSFYLLILVWVGILLFSTDTEEDYSSILNELEFAIEPVGYFSEQSLYHSTDISDDEWFSYIKYTKPYNAQAVTSATLSKADVYSSVVKIVCEDNNNYYYGSGTNFFSSGYVVTNLHVIEGNNELECVVGFPDSQSGLIVEAYWATPIIDKEDETGHDLALLSVEDPVFDEDLNIYGYYNRFNDGAFSYYEESEECLNKSPELGEKISILGYPALAGGSLTITDGLVSSLYSTDGYIITSAKIGKGNSGGLAIDSDFCFVGVPTAVYYDLDNENYGEIIDAHFVYEFLSAVSDDIDEYIK